jgi:hypothetical protein
MVLDLRSVDVGAATRIQRSAELRVCSALRSGTTNPMHRVRNSMHN